jgi:hypothetical protein
MGGGYGTQFEWVWNSLFFIDIEYISITWCF